MYSAPWAMPLSSPPWDTCLPSLVTPVSGPAISLDDTCPTLLLLTDAMKRKRLRGPMGSSPHFLIFPRVFAKPHLCFASASPPFPTPYPNGSNSNCTYETRIHRNTHVQIRILFKENLVGERLLYSHQRLSLDSELFPGKELLSHFWVPMHANPLK